MAQFSLGELFFAQHLKCWNNFHGLYIKYIKYIKYILKIDINHSSACYSEIRACSHIVPVLDLL